MRKSFLGFAKVIFMMSGLAESAPVQLAEFVRRSAGDRRGEEQPEGLTS